MKQKHILSHKLLWANDTAQYRISGENKVLRTAENRYSNGHHQLHRTTMHRTERSQTIYVRTDAWFIVHPNISIYKLRTF